MKEKRPVRRAEEDSFTRINKYLDDRNGEVQLTEQQKEMLTRMTFADEQLRSPLSDYDTASRIMKRFEVSRATAYRDIARSKRLFNLQNPFEKEYFRSVLLEMGLRDHKRALAQGDMKSAAMIMRNLIKIGAIDQEDPQIPDPTLYQQNIYVIQADPKKVLEGKELPDEAQIERLYEKYSNAKAKRQEIEDAEWKELDDRKDNPGRGA